MILGNLAANLIILVCCAIALIYAIINAFILSRIHLFHTDRRQVYSKFEDEEPEIESISDDLTHEVLEVASYIEKV